MKNILDEIFVPGTKLKSFEIENILELQKAIEETRRRQEEILALKKVDVHQLESTFINI